MTRIAHHYILTSRILRLRVSLLCLLLPCMALAADSVTQTVPLYTGLDLDTGQIEHDPTVLTLILSDTGAVDAIAAPDIDPLFQFSPDSDVSIGLSAQPDTPFAVAAYRLNGLTVLEDTPLSAIDPAQLPDMPLNPPAPSVTVDTNDLLVMQREDDRYALLGHVVQQPEIVNVRLTYWLEGRVTPTPPPMPTTTPEPPGAIPEPATLGLLATGMLGLIGFMIRKRIRPKMKGERGMKCIKTLLFVMFLISLIGGTTFAAELRIITKGTGDGIVLGEGIACPPVCKKTYENGTVIHFKADPFPGSRFGGWLVNGVSHTGVLKIENDTVVTAIFERLAGLNRLTVYWYNGNVKQEATIATDEMVVFLKERDQWGVSTEAEYQVAIQEILHRFHPQAEISNQGETILFLKSPEVLSEEQWFSALASLKNLTYVRYGGPMLYPDLDKRSGALMPTGEISVRFPTSYTQEQIQVIEQEYGLIQKKIQSLGPKVYYYYYAGDPLESIDVANHLYESGKVEHASPNWAKYMSPTAVPDDEYFAQNPPYHYYEQWHLHNTAYPPGQDIHVLDAWDLIDKNTGAPIRGSGVTIAIVDDEIEIDHIDNDGNMIGHEDLQPNAGTGLSYDFIEQDNDPTHNGKNVPLEPDYICPEPGACHGTAVAGIAAGKGFNSIGICGVAPDARLIGHRLLGAPLTIDAYVDALTRNKEIIDIYNNSWGPSKMLEVVFQDELDAIKYGTETGRNGKGNIYVFGANNTTIRTAHGNVERFWNSNGGGIANSRYVIAVTGSNQEGRLIQVPGANVLVNAPGTDILTTDRTGDRGYNYPVGFNVTGKYIQDLYALHIPIEIVQMLVPLTQPPRHVANEAELLEAIKSLIGEEQTAEYRDKFLQAANFPTSLPNLSSNYTSFAGTSSAAPVVSGVVALMLQANPNLGWRDVQQILIQTAEKNDPDDADWTENGAGYPINHKSILRTVPVYHWYDGKVSEV